MNKKGCGDECGVFIMGFFIGILVMLFILSCYGGFDTPIQKLNLNEDKIVTDYVIAYYPEYENCSIEYDFDISPGRFGIVPGINIYCEGMDNRDGMKVFREINPTISLELDGISKEDMLRYLIREYKNE